MNRIGRAVAAAFGLVWVALLGCTGPSALAPNASATMAAHHLSDVPFFPDDTDQCGWASLAGVFAYWGAGNDAAVLKHEVYVAKVGGALPMDLLLAARRHGFRAEASKGELRAVKGEIDAGRPVIAFLNLGYVIYPRGHFVIVTGYDDRRGGFYAHSGATADRFLPYDRFVQDWEKTGRWTLTIVPR